MNRSVFSTPAEPSRTKLFPFSMQMLAAHLTPSDIAKDSLLAAIGFSPAFLLTHVEVAILFGVLNLVVVIAFRAVELWLKYKK